MSNREKIFYLGDGEIIEIIIRDSSGSKLDTFKCNISDKEKCLHNFTILKDKYGIDLFKKKPDIDRDLEWLKSE